MSRHLSSQASLLLLLILGHAQGAVPNEDTPLRGINTVAINIVGLSSEVRSHRLNEEQLRSLLAERLTGAGLRVVGVNRIGAYPRGAVLSLRVNLTRSPYYFFLYGINLTVHSKLSLAGDRDVYTSAKTWSDGQVGMLMPREMRKVRDLSLELANRFIEEYRRQNSG